MVDALDDTLRRLKQERDDADRRYNEALTLLDRSLPAPREWPAAHPGLDDSQLAALNDEWKTLAAPPASGGGWRGRLTGFVWRIVAPYFEKQLTFNARLVDHLNRGAAVAREAHRSREALIDATREEFARLHEFHSRLLLLLQQVTAYVDTRDREAAGGALVLNASLSGFVENMDKRWESQANRDRRLEERASVLESVDTDLRVMASAAQQAAVTLKREMERLVGADAVAARPAAAPIADTLSDPRPPAFAPSLDAYKYVGFEDQFRGSRDAIRSRLESYAPFFAGTSDVLDVGCGRGEFLEILAQAGVRARGIDLNHEMAELCRARGLDVTEMDAVSYLSTLENESLGGLFSAQVVEHLQPAYLLRFLDLAFDKIRPGGRIVLETLNPACWVAFFDSYIRDITHVWPLHPETLKYLVLASGFGSADLEYRSPVATEDRLQTIALSGTTDGRLPDLIETFNANVDKLNSRLFTHRDYAVIGIR